MYHKFDYNLQKSTHISCTSGYLEEKNRQISGT